MSHLPSLGASKPACTKCWLRQFQLNVIQVFNDKEGVSCKELYPSHNCTKRDIKSANFWCHRLPSNESEGRTHQRIDNCKPKGDLPYGRLHCPVDRCYANYVKV